MYLGNDYTPSDSLRGIRGHKTFKFIEDPGTCDLTADVDFSAMKRALRSLDSTVFLRGIIV